jgi:hypothetical protein
MTRIYTRMMRSIAIGAAALSCLAAANRPATAPNVTYTASGTFDSTPISGSDLFRLAGQPFTISVVASESAVAKSHGAQWALYSGLSMTGQVSSRLLPTPITISNHSTNIVLADGNPNQDVFMLGTPVKILGMTITVTANIAMPEGTVSNDHILPFSAAVPLTPTVATMTYSDGTNSTTLGINGTINAK